MNEYILIFFYIWEIIKYLFFLLLIVVCIYFLINLLIGENKHKERKKKTISRFLSKNNLKGFGSSLLAICIFLIPILLFSMYLYNHSKLFPDLIEGPITENVTLEDIKSSDSRKNNNLWLEFNGEYYNLYFYPYRRLKSVEVGEVVTIYYLRHTKTVLYYE